MSAVQKETDSFMRTFLLTGKATRNMEHSEARRVDNSDKSFELPLDADLEPTIDALVEGRVFLRDFQKMDSRAHVRSTLRGTSLFSVGDPSATHSDLERRWLGGRQSRARLSNPSALHFDLERRHERNPDSVVLGALPIRPKIGMFLEYDSHVAEPLSLGRPTTQYRGYSWAPDADGRPVEYVQSFYRGDRYKFVAQLQRPIG